MLISLFGTPSELTLAGVRLLQALMQATFGGYQWISAGTAEELATAWSARQQGHALFFADIPDARITTLLAEARAPMVVFLEAPADVVRSLARRRQLTGLPALRFASQSLATLHELAMQETAVIVSPEHASAPIPDLLEHLAAHYGIPFTRRTLEDVLSRLQPMPAQATLRLLDLVPPLPADAPAPQPATEFDAELGNRALQGFEPLFAGLPLERQVWPREVFLTAEPMGAHLTGPVSLVGGARCFIFGPYFHLPHGRWSACATFSVAHNNSGNALKVDVFTDEVIFEGACVLPTRGTFQLTVVFEVSEPRLPVQLRLFNERGAIEGEVDLQHVAVTRAPGVQ
jgi:hypothetical protein